MVIKGEIIMNKEKSGFIATILDAISKMNGYQKLLVFFAPEFLLILIQKGLFEFIWSPPAGVRGGTLLFFIWLALTTWAFLLIAFQVHWKKRTRVKVAQVMTIMIAGLLIAFCMLYVIFG